MESSAISLYFSMLRRSSPDVGPLQKEFLINLIDSPGHVDFSSEVSTASRLCDGALVLVDAVEGVCSQTVTVLRQTWTEHLKPLLVINKIDRLITELKMSPGEAYVHMSQLLEQINAVIGSFYQGERMEEDLQWRERVEERVAAATAKEQERTERKATQTTNGSNLDDVESIAISSTNGDFEEKDDEDLYFAPEKNNVIFSSATDGWAFTVRQFASLYEKKLGLKRSVLEKVLWGEFYLEPKTKRVLGPKHLKGRTIKPMFVQLVLDNIWAVYEATTGGNKGKGYVPPFLPHTINSIAGSLHSLLFSDPAMVEKITKALSLTIPSHILRSRDPRAILSTVFAAWIPLSTAILVSVIEYLPAPPAAQASRLPALIEASPGADYVDKALKNAMTEFKASEHDPIVAYVSKMVSIPASELPQNKRRGGSILTAEEARDLARKKRAELENARAAAESETSVRLTGITNSLEDARLDESSEGVGAESRGQGEAEHLIGFARLYSGALSVGDSVYVLPPKFSPANPHAMPQPHKVAITGLYLLMGRGLEALSSVPAGVVFGIAGLEGHILKSGTLCSQLEGGVNLAGVNMGGEPIVRVALEPVNPGDLGKMITGMRLLEQSDPCAKYEVLESGEHVIVTAGELHLERCLKDLRERFARCEIQAGEPIVPYRESIISAAEMAPQKDRNLPRGTVLVVSTSKQISVRLRVVPLPSAVIDFLKKNVAAVRRLYAEKKAKEGAGEVTQENEDALAGDESNQELVVNSGQLSLKEFKEQLESAFTEEKGQADEWKDIVDKIAAFGPRRIGPNLLIDITESGTCQKL
jgi:ribosome assembly protein 1